MNKLIMGKTLIGCGKKVKSIKQKCLDRLNRVMPIYLYKFEIDDFKRKKYYCYYEERGVVKYALLSNPYWLRYGPAVIATLKSASPAGLWQSSSNAIDDTIYAHMETLIKTGKLELPVLNLDEFDFED